MTSITRRKRTTQRKDRRTGQDREVTTVFWRARYRDAGGKQHERHFARKTDAQRWLDEVTASVVVGTYTDPKSAKLT